MLKRDVHSSTCIIYHFTGPPMRHPLAECHWSHLQCSILGYECSPMGSVNVCRHPGKPLPVISSLADHRSCSYKSVLLISTESCMAISAMAGFCSSHCDAAYAQFCRTQNVPQWCMVDKGTEPSKNHETQGPGCSGLKPIHKRCAAHHEK
jgi:hypothetical protein